MIRFRKAKHPMQGLIDQVRQLGNGLKPMVAMTKMDPNAAQRPQRRQSLETAVDGLQQLQAAIEEAKIGEALDLFRAALGKVQA